MNLYCVHNGHLFPVVGNKTLRILKGGYIVDTIKFSDTLFQGNGNCHLEGTHYKRIFWNIRFNLFGQICLFMRRSLLVTFIVNKSKDVKNVYALRGSQIQRPLIATLVITILYDVGFNQPPVVGE